MQSELFVIQDESSQLLSDKNAILDELKKHDVARSIIGTENLICTISIMKKPKNKNQEIRLFQELDKLQGIIRKWRIFW